MKKPILIFVGLVFLSVFLSLVFSGRVILPQVFYVGSLQIHYYGIVVAAAAVAGFYLALKRADRYGIDPKTAEDLLFWIVLGGFIGARLYHVLTEFGYYRANPIEIIKIWNGGLGIYGAIAAGIISIFIYKQARGLHYKMLALMDWLTPSLIVGQVIGRFGNLFNYELFGYPTNLPWKMYVPPQFRPWHFQDSNFYHPIFLYEVVGCLIILIFISWLDISRNRAQNEGSPAYAEASAGKLFFCYLLLYNVLRFGLEYLKIGSQFIGPIRLNGIISTILIIFSAFALLYIKKHAKTS